MLYRNWQSANFTLKKGICIEGRAHFLLKKKASDEGQWKLLASASFGQIPFSFLPACLASFLPFRSREDPHKQTQETGHLHCFLNLELATQSFLTLIFRHTHYWLGLLGL